MFVKPKFCAVVRKKGRLRSEAAAAFLTEISKKLISRPFLLLICLSMLY